MTWKIVIAPEALKMIEGITDRRVRGIIERSIDGLELDPDRQGKPLGKELSGNRSKKVAGRRYRIVYRIDFQKHVVYIKGIGIRREGSKNDIYERMKKRL